MGLIAHLGHLTTGIELQQQRFINISGVLIALPSGKKKRY